MKKTYQRPVFSKSEKLSRVTAIVVISGKSA